MEKQKSTMKSFVRKSLEKDFSLETIDIPIPGKDEILVKNVASPINPSDMIHSQGYFFPVQYPLHMGIEGYGIVIDNNGQENINKGDYVSYWSFKAKSWSEYSVVPVNELLVVPKYEGDEIKLGATFFLNPITALGLFELITIGSHKSVAFNAGASQVSKMLIKICKEKGIKTIAIVRRDDQVKQCLDIEADIALNEENKDFAENLAESVKETTLFFDSVGGNKTTDHLKNFPNKTKVYSYGGLSGEHLNPEEVENLTKRDFTFGSFFFMSYFNTLDSNGKIKLSENISKNINTVFSSTFNKFISIDQISQGINDYYDKMTSGKVVIKF